jgi:proteasome lid subunit RPN8/RPN11
MQTKELGLHFEFASWRVPQFSRAIEYPLEVMEEIRAFACDELLQLSHGGDAVGGVLFGTRREDLIRILTWRPLACDRTQGEGLKLSYNDRMNLAVQLEVARQNSDLKDLRPVGWFVSHLRTGVSLSPSDLETYNGFFPESWQVTLVICPQGRGHAQAGFFLREADGKLQTEASYQVFELAPLNLPVATEPEAPRKAAIAAAPEPAPVEKPPAPKLQEPEVAKPEVAKPEVAKRAESQPENLPAPAFRPTPPLEAPSFEVEEDLPARERWLWAIPIALALAIAGFLLYQRRPSPNASISLRAISEAQTVQLAWDANSRLIRDADHAEMEINDGAKDSHVSLTSDQLHAGKMSYLPQSNDVGFSMTVYPANGEPIHDSARLVAPVANAPQEPPQLLQSNPPPAPAAPAVSPAPSEAENATLQQQVQQLKEEVGKERARADGLQNLVRILENRLGISSTAPKTSAPKTDRRR